MKYTAKILVLMVTAFMLTTACSKNPQEQILGEWRDFTKNIIYDFSEDGKLTLSKSGYGSQIASWRMLEEGRMAITYPGESEHEAKYNFTESGALELDFPGKKKFLLTRLGSTIEDSGATEVAGRYNCNGMLDWLELRGSGNSYISFMGMKEIAATYEIDGNRVIVTANGKNEVFTRSGDTLTYGKLSTCNKER